MPRTAYHQIKKYFDSPSGFEALALDEPTFIRNGATGADMTSYKPHSATVHNHFSKHSFTLPYQLKPQVLSQKSVDLLTGEVQRTASVSYGAAANYSVIDDQSPADKAAGSSVSSF